MFSVCIESAAVDAAAAARMTVCPVSWRSVKTITAEQGHSAHRD